MIAGVRRAAPEERQEHRREAEAFFDRKWEWPEVRALLFEGWDPEDRVVPSDEHEEALRAAWMRERQRWEEWELAWRLPALAEERVPPQNQRRFRIWLAMDQKARALAGKPQLDDAEVEQEFTRMLVEETVARRLRETERPIWERIVARRSEGHDIQD